MLDCNVPNSLTQYSLKSYSRKLDVFEELLPLRLIIRVQFFVNESRGEMIGYRQTSEISCSSDEDVQASDDGNLKARIDNDAENAPFKYLKTSELLRHLLNKDKKGETIPTGDNPNDSPDSDNSLPSGNRRKKTNFLPGDSNVEEEIRNNESVIGSENINGLFVGEESEDNRYLSEIARCLSGVKHGTMDTDCGDNEQGCREDLQRLASADSAYSAESDGNIISDYSSEFDNELERIISSNFNIQSSPSNDSCDLTELLSIPVSAFTTNGEVKSSDGADSKSEEDCIVIEDDEIEDSMVLVPSGTNYASIHKTR